MPTPAPYARRPRPSSRWIVLASLAASLLAADVAAAADDLLPDLVVMANDLYDHAVVDDVVPGRVHLRLANATANFGAGKLLLYGVDTADPQRREVRQRVFRSDGTWTDRVAGTFVYHTEHEHIHVEDWARYNLREWLPGDGVGAILAAGSKTSYCVIDLRVEDSTLPGHVLGGEFHACDSNVQGLSVGWSDVYGKSLPDQWIDVTGIPDGIYWLESVVDPSDHVLELDETNNTTRIKITLGTPLPINPDRYEPNDSTAAVLARSVGQTNSPNLGPCAPVLELSGLTLHEAGDEDRFRFYLPATGATADEVRIDFVHVQGDLDLQLLDDAGTVLAASTTVQDHERIGLLGRPRGWYQVRVYGFQGATTPAYTLRIDPSSNAAPSIVVDAPTVGDARIVQSLQSYPIRWTASDPDGDPTWVTVRVNALPQFDGNEILLETSLHTAGELGEHVLNSAYLPVGSWWIHTEVTDGGSVAGAWSAGTLTLVDQALVAAPPAPREVFVLRAVPNPFNPRTVLHLTLARDAVVRWTVHDARGTRVRTLYEGALERGLHALAWDGRDDDGVRVAGGVYHVVVRDDAAIATRKVVLLQ